MGLLIYAALTFLLSLAALKKQSRLLLFFIQFQSFLFVFFFFWFTRENYRIIQIRKIGYQLEKVTNNFREPARIVSLGGDASKDDIFIADLPPKAIQITPSLSGTVSDVLVNSDGLLAFKRTDPLNVTVLNDGDRIQCGNDEVTFASHGAFRRSFVHGDRTWNWPRNEWRIQKQKEPVLTSGFSSRLFAISDVAQALGLSCDNNAAFSMQQIHFSGGRHPIQLNSVVLLGAGKKLRVNGQFLQDHFSFQDGDVLRLYSISSRTDPAKLQSAASFQIHNGDTLDLLLPAPQILGIKEDLLRNGSAINKPLFLSTSTLPYSVFPTAHYSRESKRFSGLFAFIQTQDYSQASDIWDQMEQRLQNIFLIVPSTLEVVTDQGSFRPSYGNRFSLGRADKMIFSIHKVDFPWVLLQTLLILWIAKMLFQPPFFAAIENVGLQLLVLTTDFFLITRFLFSFRASNLYPFSPESLTLSLFAILIVPYLLFAGPLLARRKWERRQSFNFVAYAMIVLVLAATLVPDYLWLAFAIVLVFATIAVIRFYPRLSSRVSTQWARMKMIPVEIYLGLFVIAAFLMQALGTGEAIQAFGIRFPLAVLYHPVLILFASHYLARIHHALTSERTGPALNSVLRDLLKLGLVLISFAFVSLLTSDFGFLLLYSVPVFFVLFGIGARYIREYELSWKSAGLAMAAPLLLFLCLFVGSGWIDRLVPISAMGNRTVQRILLTLAPSVLENSGLVTTERQLGHQRTFVAYSHSGLLGGGYMNRPITSALSGTALNDNVPAAFLLNDFGVLGFLAICFILLFWILLWWKSQSSEFRLSSFISLTALITIIYVDLYMTLSNCGIFLFTGKNFFFWGLNSVSDIFHSSLLVFLVAVFGAWRGPDHTPVIGEQKYA